MKTIPGAKSAARSMSIFAISVSLAMAQQPAGTIRSWGRNSDGQLGDGLAGDSAVPRSVVGLSGVIAVATGNVHSLALKSDGSVFAWGRNDFGQLGDGTTTSKSLPVAVSGLGSGSRVIAIAAGFKHSLALKSDGSVWAWGHNDRGQLGDATAPANKSAPVAVSGLGSGSGVIAIAAGAEHNLALKSDGSVFAWGFNGSGQLGDGTNSDKSVPVAVSGMGSGSGVIAVAGGLFHSLVLKSDGSVAAWGFNDTFELGIGTKGSSSTPVGVSGLGSGADVIAIASGSDHNLVLKSDGSVFAWGFNRGGQLGDGTNSDQPVPVAVSGLGSGSGVIAIVGHTSNSLALRSDGSLLTWGGDSLTPVQVSSLNGGVALAPGGSVGHNLVIVQPVAALSATSLSFGDQLVGSLSASQMVTIENKGQDLMVINSLALSGAAAADFKVSAPPMPFTIAPGASAAFSVAFNPSAEFARLATLLIDDNGFDAPQFIALSGNGLVRADIAVGLGANPTPVHNDKDLTYTISVKNAGPTSAPTVVMSDAPPAGTVFRSGKTTQGTCVTPAAGTTGTVTCNLGTLNSGAAATITLVVTVHLPGGSTLVNTASAIAGAPDPNLGNNSVTVVTPVFGSKR